MSKLKEIKVLRCNGTIGKEIRSLFFYRAFGENVPICRVISFGACNFYCRYCKRNGYFRSIDGSIIDSIKIDISRLFTVCDNAMEKEQVIRLSGGDPVMFPETSIALAQYVKKHAGRISIAHNGSSPAFIREISKYIESAAIDLKAPVSYMSTIVGLNHEIATSMFWRSMETQRILLENGVMLDVRTPIFNFTTLDDLLLLAEELARNNGDKKFFWTLRAYSEVVGCEFKKPRIENLIWMANKVKKIFPKFTIGIRAKWNTRNFIYL